MRSAPGTTERLNVLLTDRGEDWAEQLPRLLEPQGVTAVRADTVDRALDALNRQPIHIAVVELDLPADDRAAAATHERIGGLKLLRVINSLEHRPPSLVVRGRRFSGREDDRVLEEALKLNVFSVLDQPIALERMLQTLQRMMHRYYGDRWPEA